MTIMIMTTISVTIAKMIMITNSNDNYKDNDNYTDN